MSDRKVLLRIDPELLARVDARAEHVALSRNAWLVKALEWALDQPVREIPVQSVDRT